MGKTFRDMVREARREIKVISAQEAKPVIERGAAMLIDVREAWEIAQHGTIPGARNITRGELEIKADTELPRRDPALADRGQKIFLTCGAGGKSTLCAKALGDMGFTDVWVIDGGCRGWKDAGYDLAAPPEP
jgi:rhodanese-related sulfurtransferase